MIRSKLDLEGRVLQIIEMHAHGQYSEDDLVEFKREWPLPAKMARQLAGQCNAAMGHQVLWIIGLDEKVGVTGTAHQDRAKWWPQVEAGFEGGVTPHLIHDINVPVGEAAVSALLFGTDRAPYVVRIGQPGQVAFEVPWRAGTSVRSARREDLVNMLYGRKRAPSATVLSARGDLMPMPENPGFVRVDIVIEAYIAPVPGTRHVWPFHSCGIRLSQRKGRLGVIWTEARISDSYGDIAPYMIQNAPQIPPGWRESKALSITRHEAVLAGPGCVFVKARFACEDAALSLGSLVGARVALIDAEDESPTTFEVNLRPVSCEDPSKGVGSLEYTRDHEVVAFPPDNPLLRALELDGCGQHRDCGFRCQA